MHFNSVIPSALGFLTSLKSLPSQVFKYRCLYLEKHLDTTQVAGEQSLKRPASALRPLSEAWFLKFPPNDNESSLHEKALDLNLCEYNVPGTICLGIECKRLWRNWLNKWWLWVILGEKASYIRARRVMPLPYSQPPQITANSFLHSANKSCHFLA